MNGKFMKIMKDILNYVTFFTRDDLSEHFAYPNQVVELAKPIVEQFIWVVRTVWHFDAELRRVLKEEKRKNLHKYLISWHFVWLIISCQFLRSLMNNKLERLPLASLSEVGMFNATNEGANMKKIPFMRRVVEAAP